MRVKLSFLVPAEFRNAKSLAVSVFVGWVER